MPRKPIDSDAETRMPCPACERCERCKGESVEQCVHCDPVHAQSCPLCAVCSLCCGTQMVTVTARLRWLQTNPHPPSAA